MSEPTSWSRSDFCIKCGHPFVVGEFATFDNDTADASHIGPCPTPFTEAPTEDR